MSDTKHTLTVKISDRIEWINKRCGLTEIQKDYIAAQMKEAVGDAISKLANDSTAKSKQAFAMPVVSTRYEVIKQELADWNIVAISDTKEKKIILHINSSIVEYDEAVRLAEKIAKSLNVC